MIGHPFNPVYLCPGVEVVPGKKTQKKFLNKANKVPHIKRRTPEDIKSLRMHCRAYSNTEKDVSYTYRARDFDKRYNGAGFKGTGGPNQN